MGALDVQIGGNHYKGLKYQPVELAVALNFNFIQGNILKYISRYKNKNGEQDLQKIIHYANLGSTLNPRNYYGYTSVERMEVEEFLDQNNFYDTPIEKIVTFICYQNWSSIISEVSNLIKEEYGTVS